MAHHNLFTCLINLLAEAKLSVTFDLDVIVLSFLSYYDEETDCCMLHNSLSAAAMTTYTY